MTPSEFAASVPGFDRLNYTEQVELFCWYLTVRQSKETLSTSDVGACFDQARHKKPSSIGPFLQSLSNRKPPSLLRRGKSFVLAQSTRMKLDAKLGHRDVTVAVDALLSGLPTRLTNPSERVYLEEALTCFRHGAFRATIVMAWNLAYDHLCNLILNKELSAFNAQLPRSFPKADIKNVASRDDFEALKESQVLQVAKSANIISGSVHKILKEKLDRRNIAAHPSGVAVSPHTAEEFVLDLIQNVVIKYLIPVAP